MPALTGSGRRFRCRRSFQILWHWLLSGPCLYNSISVTVPENDLGWQIGLHPRSVEGISTYTARRSECSSPPRGPYHSRRTLWKTTQATKTTPAATDGSNIKFSSVTELFLSSAQPPEERCSDRPRIDPRSPRLCPHNHGRTVTNTQSLSPRGRTLDTAAPTVVHLH